MSCCLIVFGVCLKEGGALSVAAFNMWLVANWRGKREGMMEIEYAAFCAVGTKRKKKHNFYAHFTHNIFSFSSFEIHTVAP